MNMRCSPIIIDWEIFNCVIDFIVFAGLLRGCRLCRICILGAIFNLMVECSCFFPLIVRVIVDELPLIVMGFVKMKIDTKLDKDNFMVLFRICFTFVKSLIFLFI